MEYSHESFSYIFFVFLFYIVYLAAIFLRSFIEIVNGSLMMQWRISTNNVKIIKINYPFSHNSNIIYIKDNKHDLQISSKNKRHVRQNI